MSIATAIQNLTNTIRALATTKGQIKTAVNTDIDFIANEQIEQYPSLIRTAIERYKSYIPTEKQTAKQVSLSTVPLKAKEIAVLGDTFQQSYTGKNLFNYAGSKLELAQLDITRMKIVSSTSIILGYIQCKPNTIYTISRRSPMSIRFQVGTTENEPVVGATLLSLEVVNNSTTTSITITTPANANYIVIRFIYDQIDYYETYAKTIQIEEGPTATDYEPYVGGTASPNPDYPQTIQVVTGTQTIIKNGKNLFDKNNANILNNTYIGSSEISTSNGAKTLYIPCLSNTTYTISKIAGQRFIVGDTNTVPANQVSIRNRVNNNTGTSITITTSADASYLVVYYYLASADTLTEQKILDSMQIEKGSTATTYEPYITPVELPLDLGDMELLKINTHYDIIQKSNNKWIIPNKSIKINSYNGETITTDYISTTGGLNTGATVYYVGNTDYEITDTALINQLEEIDNLNMNDGTTVIYAENEEGLQPTLYVKAYAKAE